MLLPTEKPKDRFSCGNLTFYGCMGFMFWTGLVGICTSGNEGPGAIIAILFYLSIPILAIGYRRGWIWPEPRTPEPEPPPEPVGEPGLYKITLGNLEKWSPQTAVSLLQSVIELAGKVVIEFYVVADHKNISFAVFLDIDHIGQATLQSLVNKFYPDASVSVFEYDNPEMLPQYCETHIFKRSEKHYFFDTLQKASDIKTFDPLAQLVRTMRDLQEDERLVFSITLIGERTFDEETIDFLVTQTMAEAGLKAPMYGYHKDFAEAFGAAIARAQVERNTRVARFSAAEERRHRAKLGQKLQQTMIALQYFTPYQERLDTLSGLVATMHHMSNPDHPLIEAGYSNRAMIKDPDNPALQPDPVRTLYKWMESEEKFAQLRASQHLFLLTYDELAALWHLPHEGFLLEQEGYKQVKAPRAVLKQTGGVQIGVNRFSDQEQPIYLPAENRLEHLAVIGRTGTGKSALLHQMIHTDIENGLGVCVIDPEGYLVSCILQHSIPPGRESDLVVLDTATPVNGRYYPPPLNLLANGKGGNPEAVARRLMSVFDDLFRDIQSRRMADTLNNVLQTVCYETHPTLLDIRRLFLDPDHALSLIEQSDDFIVREFWEDYLAMSERERRNLYSPILWRLRGFYNYSYLQAMTCHPLTLNIDELLSQNKIILVSLGQDAEGVMPARERFILGAALVSQIEVAARRKAIKKSPYMLYIDEAHEFVRTALPDMLSQMRKRDLGIVLANQYYKQLFGETLDAIEGNVGTLVAFEVGKSDAAIVSAYTKPQFLPDNLVKMGKYKAAVYMRLADERQDAFSLETLPPPGMGTRQPSREETLRWIAIENLGLADKYEYNQVQAWIRRRYDGANILGSIDQSYDDEPKRGSDQVQDDDNEAGTGSIYDEFIE